MIRQDGRPGGSKGVVAVVGRPSVRENDPFAADATVTVWARPRDVRCTLRTHNSVRRSARVRGSATGALEEALVQPRYLARDDHASGAG